MKALDNEDKYTPDTNFKGWMYTIMRNIFINNYRKVVRDQTFVDKTDNLYHLNLPQDAGFESTERTYDLKEMHRVVNALPKEYRVPAANRLLLRGLLSVCMRNVVILPELLPNLF